MTEPHSGPQAPVDRPGSSDHPQPSLRATFWAHLCQQLDLILDHVVKVRYVGHKARNPRIRCYSEICGICGHATMSVFAPDARRAPHYPGCPVTLLWICLDEIEEAEVGAPRCMTVPFSALRPAPEEEEEPGDRRDYSEPWSSPPDAYETVVDKFGETVVDMLGSDLPKRFEADYARRIAACVNFCHRIPTDVLETAAAAKLPKPGDQIRVMDEQVAQIVTRSLSLALVIGNGGAR